MPRHFLIIIVFIIVLLIGFLSGYFLCTKSWESKKNVLLKPYRDWFITKEMYLDVDNDNQEERLVAITDKLWDISSTSKVLVLQDKRFIEVPGYGASIIWWQAGDFNNNGKIELIVKYDNYGSGGYWPWYLYEFDGEVINVLIEREEIASQIDIKDLDGDGRIEIRHTFSIPEHPNGLEIFKWDIFGQEYMLSDSH